MPLLNINKADIYYEMTGSGPAIVIISGYANQTSYWKPIVDELKQHFTVILFDNRGSGQTQDNHEKLSIDLMAEDTIELIRALKLKKPHVLGYSMGSCIAQSLAANFGSEIDKLLLVSSTPKFRLAALNYLRAALELRKNPNNLESVLDLYFAFTYSEETLSNNDKLQGLKKEILDNPHLPSVDNSSRQYEALKSFNSLKQLKLIENETLIIHGREDILCLPMEAQYIAAHLKEASFVELYVGHGIPKESPKELTSLILQFLLTNHAHRPDPYSYS